MYATLQWGYFKLQRLFFLAKKCIYLIVDQCDSNISFQNTFDFFLIFSFITTAI
jgi:hypothetical protein